VNARIRRWMPVWAWIVVIEIATSWPNPSVPAGLPEGSDKVVHLGMYGMLGLLAARALGLQRWSRDGWRLLVAAACISCFGALDEWHQQFIPGRGMELGDWIADSTGGFLGLVAFTFMAGVLLARRETRS